MSNFSIQRVPRERMQERFGRRGTRISNRALVIALAILLIGIVIVMPKEWGTSGLPALVPGGVSPAFGRQSVPPLRISEVMSSNEGAFANDFGAYSGWVEIENTTDEPIQMENIGLSNIDGWITFLFPHMELQGGGFLLVYCDGTNISSGARPLHAGFTTSPSGESVHLYDRNASPLDSVSVPALYHNTAYARTADGWAVTDDYTPGFPNTEAGHAAFLATAVAPATSLALNELVAGNCLTLADEDGDQPAWIELYNGTSQPIDLSTYTLSNDPYRPAMWRFPKGAVIAPDGYYLVFASGKDRPGGNGWLPHANFRLSSTGETITLTDAMNHTVDRVTYERLPKDSAYARAEGLLYTWQTSANPTPGLPNTLSGETRMDEAIRSRNTSGIFLSEVMTASTGIETPFGKTSYTWIEVTNLSGSPVNLTGWGLSNEPGHPRLWQFPETVIEPHTQQLVFTSGLTEPPTGSKATHADFRLTALGENITLSDPSGNIVDKLVVPRLETNVSYGRDFDSGLLLYFDTPTPGEPNTPEGYIGYASTPTIHRKGGLLTRPVTVEITAPEGVSIRYTLDGSEPTPLIGRDYEGPINISKAVVLRARGFADGLKPSLVATESYLINVAHVLPVISLTVDPDDLWNPETGLYADGLDETFETPPFRNATYYRVNKDPLLRQRAANFEFFTADGQQMLNQGVGVQLNGNFSLDLPQKSFRVAAKPEYGSTSFAYPFFENREDTSYGALLLRNGGDDGVYTRIIDPLISTILDETDTSLMHMPSTPAILYLNGEYWGQYMIRDEGFNDPRNTDVIKGDRDVLYGGFSDYSQLIDYVKKHDLNDETVLKRVLDWIDVDSYFDFIIFQTYFGNTDTMNIEFYRQRVSGAKWRWILLDMDWAYFNRKANGFNAWLKAEGTGDKKGDNTLIRALLKVPEMRDKFLTRYGELFQLYLTDTDRIIELIDETVKSIELEMPRHFSRWAEEIRQNIAFDLYTARNNAFAYWTGRINRLKNTARARPHYVYTLAQQWFELNDTEMRNYFGPMPEEPEDIY